ncbi:MAG: ABC transporter ATP-binding protein [Nocardioides sp.]
MLAAHRVWVTYRGQGTPALAEVSLALVPGQLTALVGPNGSGKSTLLRLLYGAVTPDSGEVVLDERPLGRWPVRERASRIAVVAQESPSEIDLTVAEYAGLGLMVRRRPLAGRLSGDLAAVRSALRAVNAEGFESRSLASLSGGERQRVHLARAIVQRADHLLLDEPTNHLDVRHQHEVLNLVAGLGFTSLVVLHDLNLAARYADRILLLHQGRVVIDGPPAQACAPPLVERVYGVRCALVPDRVPPHLVFDPIGGRPVTTIERGKEVTHS